MSEQENISTLTLYKNLLIRLRNLILRPASEWEKIESEDKKLNNILSEFSLPLIAVATLATFLDYIINYQGFAVELALKQSLATFTSLFGGLYLVYLTLKFLLPYFGIAATNDYSFALAAYSSGLWYLINLISSLIPELLFLQLFSLYTLYIVWTQLELRVTRGLIIGKPQRLLLTVLITIIIHILPYLIWLFLLKLISL